MDECAACGSSVDEHATYCDACSDGSASHSATDSTGDASVVASPRSRAVGTFLAVGALLGGFATLESLQYLPEVLQFQGAVDSLGFLLTQSINVGLVAAFAVMSKRLFTGNANTDRYGTILKALAVASILSGVLVAALPNALVRWLPTVFDPGYVSLNVAARYLYPTVFGAELSILVLGLVGAAITFAAGTSLERDPAR